LIRATRAAYARHADAILLAPMTATSTSPSSDAVLSVRGLAKTYGKGWIGKKGFRALDGVSLDVTRGTVFGLLGPNGAGKTTLIKILLGLVRGHEGEALLFGRPPGDPDSRKRIGFLPEAHRLPGYLTGRQVVRLFGMMSGAPESEIEQRMPRLLELVGMQQSADRKVREYSKGMQQRIGLAQALIHAPDLVFLDEPTDGVDPVGRAAIRAIVQDLKRDGVTVFINSHLLMEVELVCDRVVIMTKGKVLREGSVDELTPRTGAAHFELRAVPENLDRMLAGIGTDFRLAAGGFELKVSDDEMQQAIDRLRAASVAIRGISQRRLTLEESFIHLVKEPR
jgi:ABC-2 type transport system ATP-binding protein